MKKCSKKPDDFINKIFIKGFEGGAFYTAALEGKFYLIIDESSLSEFLSEEDLEGIDLTSVYEFESESELQNYLEYRGWF